VRRFDRVARAEHEGRVVPDRGGAIDDARVGAVHDRLRADPNRRRDAGPRLQVPDVRLDLVVLDVEVGQIEERGLGLAGSQLLAGGEEHERDLRDVPHRPRFDRSRWDRLAAVASQTS
jgi:hypothetical protein